MGMKIKYWTKAVDHTETPKLTKAGKPRKVKASTTRKASDRFVEIEKDIAEVGITVDIMNDENKEEQFDAAIQAIPGIIYGWGVSFQKY